MVQARLHTANHRPRVSSIRSLVVAMFAGLLLALTAGIAFGQSLPSAGANLSAGHQTYSATPTHVTGQLLVQRRAGIPDSTLHNLLAQHGAQVIDTIAGIDVLVLNVPEERLETIREALSHNVTFTFVERNFVGGGGYLPNDPNYGSEWHLSKVSAPSGWNISTGDTGIIIAVIDSGVDPSHPDLAAKLLPGYNYLNRNTDTHDVLGHGTAVAGTAAAISDNQTGVAGIAWRNPVLPLVVLNSSNYATYSDIASAIIFAADNGAKVINISIGGSSYSSTLQSAVNYAWNKGVVIVASAMNNSSSTPMYPAALDNVIAASATDKSDNFASFSNYGQWIDLSAPGVSILTTSNGGSYGSWSGTSFSSPIIAGLAALVFSAKPTLTNAQVIDLMRQNSDDLGVIGYDNYFGHGRVNVNETLLAASGAVTTQDVTPPTAAIASPADGGTVSGTVGVTVSAIDDVAVAKVDLYLDGAYFASDTTSPYSFAWNTSGFANGLHGIVAYAYDSAGNMAGSPQVSVQVNNGATDVTPPSVSITSPYSGATVSGITKVSISAIDDVGVVKVEFYLDGKLSGTLTASPYTFNWNTRKAASGSHVIGAKAYDAAGNAGTAASITVKK